MKKLLIAACLSTAFLAHANERCETVAEVSWAIQLLRNAPEAPAPSVVARIVAAGVNIDNAEAVILEMVNRLWAIYPRGKDPIEARDEIYLACIK